MKDADFERRRAEGRKRLDAMDKGDLGAELSRKDFFAAVYDQAAGDEAAIPWADMEVKPYLREWLEQNPKHRGHAMDIGCGLGDNAEALAEAGYTTTAFDFSNEAIEWAKKRFPQTQVNYETADLMELPKEWHQGFDLVHESYTLQSIPPDTLDITIPATASLVAKGGRLLVYARYRNDGVAADGPPWPIEISRAMSFSDYGLELVHREDFVIKRHDRDIPHILCEWRRP